MNSRFPFRPFLFVPVSPLRVPQVPLAVAFTASLLGFSSFSLTPVSAQTAPAAAKPVVVNEAKPIVVNIDGRVSSPDPAPLLEGGVVYVPLRGVLENLGARVEYFPAEKRIEIRQNDKIYILRPGIANATVNTEMLPLAAPKLVAGRAFVPLRSLAELFGYRVGWLSAERTVAIYTNDSLKPVFVDHRAQLRSGGAFGVDIDFSGVPLSEIPRLLDAAKSAGAGLVKTRFDWNTLQPERNGVFDWSVYDAVVREARVRGLKVVGVLGNSAKWASVSLSSQPDEWRNSPPKESELAAWSNYVKRVVGRYRVDVQAWQIWENPSAQNFRSVPRVYRNLVRLATDAARVSDSKAIIHAAEPGGVELDFIADLTRNGLTSSLDGVSVFPVAQWQPGVANAPENFILPYATLRDQNGRTRDYWLGGASAPAVELKNPEASLTEAQRELLATFSPAAQADYLVRLFSLSLAGGSEKLFWNPLQDSPQSAREALSPFVSGTGLVRADGTRRPAFNAFKMLSENVGNRRYAGNLAFDRNAIALLFDDKKTGTLVAWSPNGAATLNLVSSGVPNPQLPGSTYVATRPDSQVLDSSGAVIAPPDGVLRLTERPIVITNVALDTATAAAARLDEGGLRLAATGTSYAAAQEVKATFTPDGVEDGLFWRRFRNFGGMARKFSTYDRQQNGLVTEAQREILDLQSAKPFIYLDVADDFLFYAGGVPVTISVEVRRPSPSSSSIINSASGFRIEYDSPTGYKSTPFQIVEPGEGWATYTFPVPDATFANAEGYDLLINTNGSKRNLTFGSLSVRRGAPSVAQSIQ